MFIWKLAVLIVYLEFLDAYRTNYCEICINHTLCLFPESGPSLTCKDYSTKSLLTQDDIMEIVNRINEKRNFISMGLSHFFPQAANMRKICWSDKLAASAQRWVDQCDQYIHPDREDYCRDIGNDVTVGQNIATILGSTSGLNVKSFVDVWYMKSIHYTGSVTFYNQSMDKEALYFTQLVWADTSTVGCGRAKFLIVEKNITADRLVCNFAPKGNIDGKPVYTIGYPATQCPLKTEMDRTFPGLCQHKDNKNGKFTTRRPPVSSLLRILNLSNDSVKQEIDPIHSNLKQVSYGRNKTIGQRNQRIRHVLLNKTNGVARKNPSVRSQSSWKNPENIPKHNLETLYKTDRGHSRMYHGFEPRIEEHYNNLHEDFRKYDFTTKSVSAHVNDNFRKYDIQTNHCTRKIGSSEACINNECNTYKCTRGKSRQTIPYCHTICSPHINTVETSIFKFCPCNEHKTTYSTLFPSNCVLNCHSTSTEICQEMRCPNFRRAEGGSQEQIHKPKFNLFNSAPHLVLKSGGDNKKSLEISPHYTRNFHTDIDEYPITESYRIEQYLGFKHSTHPHRNPRLSKAPEYVHKLYESLDSNKRKKRDNIEPITFRPFWQDDQFSNKNILNLKSIRYTSLPRKERKKTKRTASTIKPSIITEAITIKLKELSTNNNDRGHISEKYLSFDELMHIRKMSTLGIDHNARRKFNESGVLREDTPTTTVATIETPFVRKKHCTRKLTCTWTAFTATGNIILPGGGDFGSRTPPGYVDGCTRTSTCTRDFQDRNKIATIPDPTSIEPSPEDEDYCEKRSLNIRRRDSDNRHFQDTTEYSATTIDLLSKELDNHEYKTSPMLKISCHCKHEHTRTKREEGNRWQNAKIANKYLTYGDLYYLVLEKIIKSWEDNRHLYHSSKCLCNTATIIRVLNIYTLFLIFYIYEVNY